MSVRKRKWTDKQGRSRERWMVHIEHTWPDGRKQVLRKVSPVQTKRGAEVSVRVRAPQIAYQVPLPGRQSRVHGKQETL